jgi:hypothetical protein
MKRVLSANKAMFQTSRQVNWNKLMHWSDSNLHHIQEQVYATGLTDWVRIWLEGLINPYILDGTIIKKLHVASAMMEVPVFK